MPKFGNTRLEVGDEYDGWILVHIDHISPGAQRGSHAFVFRRDSDTIGISNKYWISDRMPCSLNGNFGECPEELRMFGCKDTKITYETALRRKPLRK